MCTWIVCVCVPINMCKKTFSIARDFLVIFYLKKIFIYFFRRSTVAEQKNISASSIVSEQKKTFFSYSTAEWYFIKQSTTMYDVVVVVYYRNVCLHVWVVTEFIATWRNQKKNNIYVRMMAVWGRKNRCAQKFNLFCSQSIVHSHNLNKYCSTSTPCPYANEINIHTNNVRNTNELACNVMCYICP